MNISNNFMKNKMTMFQRRRSFEMHGKVWMFSDLIDDEDMEFMQHEFISYVLQFLNLTSNIPNLALIGIMILKVGIAVMIPAWKMGRENIISER